MRAVRGLLVNCESAPKWDASESLYLDRFARAGDDWTVCSVAAGQALPPAADYDAVILTGSHDSCYAELEWVDLLVAWLQGALSLPDESAPRMFGVCFGHQVLGRAAGAQVGRTESGRFFLRNEIIHPTASFLELPWAAGLWEVDGDGTHHLVASGFEPSVSPLTSEFAEAPHSDIRNRPRIIRDKAAASAASDAQSPGSSSSTTIAPLRLLKSHGDAVRSLPPNSLLLASSSSTAYEVLLVGPTPPEAPAAADSSASTSGSKLPWERFRALTVQAHPEFTPREMEAKILPALRERMGAEEEAAFHATKTEACHDWTVLEIAQRFLRRCDEPVAAQ